MIRPPLPRPVIEALAEGSPPVGRGFEEVIVSMAQELTVARQRILELEAAVAAGTRFDERAANMYTALCAVYPVYRAAITHAEDVGNGWGDRMWIPKALDAARAALTPDLVAALRAAGLEEP